ncbi:hypothetical protein AWC05_12455 [Mycobacterium florentinum]|uniref:ANTAR domain-containing protein n=2 Tax=Mycobacterium florentinum TaxID=292462 RepID=A0A1X1UGL9_MYCFL|nr:hypothetical protein AWC05_12455 [Mycobacterium florentinum]
MLIALRGCTSNQAFVEIVETARAHNVGALSLADALVAIAQDEPSQNGEDAAFSAARAAWGHLLDGARRAEVGGEHDGVAGA